MDQQPSSLKLQLLGASFVLAVVLLVANTHQFIVPIFFGLLAWSKVVLKKLTPKLGLLLAKNSFFIQLRSYLMKISTHLFVKSHKPWRRILTRIRVALFSALSGLFEAYLALPLWVRTGVALAVLAATAGSSFAVFALLIIPQPLLDWLGRLLSRSLNRLGVTQMLTALWKLLVPERLRYRWHLFVKWELGRRQVRAARKIHERVSQRPVKSQPETSAYDQNS
ncbi:MAG: hypothetical protein AAGG55_11100 [Pseudomonadota bacterium]